MSFQEFVRLVKSYEAELKYGPVYMQKINEYVINHPENIYNIKERLILDSVFRNRFFKLINRHRYYSKLTRFEEEYNESRQR